MSLNNDKKEPSEKDMEEVREYIIKRCEFKYNFLTKGKSEMLDAVDPLSFYLGFVGGLSDSLSDFFKGKNTYYKMKSDDNKEEVEEIS